MSYLSKAKQEAGRNWEKWGWVRKVEATAKLVPATVSAIDAAVMVAREFETAREELNCNQDQRAARIASAAYADAFHVRVRASGVLGGYTAEEELDFLRGHIGERKADSILSAERKGARPDTIEQETLSLWSYLVANASTTTPAAKALATAGRNCPACGAAAMLATVDHCLRCNHGATAKPKAQAPAPKPAAPAAQVDGAAVLKSLTREGLAKARLDHLKAEHKRVLGRELSGLALTSAAIAAAQWAKAKHAEFQRLK